MIYQVIIFLWIFEFLYIVKIFIYAGIVRNLF
jgi:hypothetical protein